MVYRRKRKRSNNRKKTFTISAIEGGTALSLAQSTGLDTALKSALGGNLSAALTTIQTQTLANKTKIIGVLGAAFVGKMIVSGFGRKQLAKLGPIRIVP